MPKPDDREFYEQRMRQEVAASQRASEPLNKRLHWEMAQRYHYLAEEKANKAPSRVE